MEAFVAGTGFVAVIVVALAVVCSVAIFFAALVGYWFFCH